jgi:AbrB family looped-hinge helix DNA binding protein
MSSGRRLAMQTTRARLASGGRIVIPAEYRKALGLHEGDIVTMQLEDGEIRLYSFEEGLRRAQALVRELVPEGVSLVDELIAERRREAALE